MWAVSWRQGTRQRNSSVFQCSVWTAGFIRTPVSVSGCRENSVFNCVGHVWIKSVYACKMSGYVELRNCSVRPFASRLTNCVSACVFRQLISLEPRLSPITSQAGWLMSAGCINLFFFFFCRSRLDCRQVFHSFTLSIIIECFQLITCSFFTVGAASDCNEYQNYLLVHTLDFVCSGMMGDYFPSFIFFVCVLPRENVHNSHHRKLTWSVCVFNWTGRSTLLQRKKKYVMDNCTCIHHFVCYWSTWLAFSKILCLTKAHIQSLQGF